MKRAGLNLRLIGIACALGMVIVLLWTIRSSPVGTNESSEQNFVAGPEPVDSKSETPSRVAGNSWIRTAATVENTLQVIEPEVKGDAWERVRIVKKAGAFPFMRLVEKMARNPESDEPIVVGRVAMLADHVAISVPEGGDEAAIREAVEALGYSVNRAYPFSPVWQIALGRHDPAAVPDAVAAIGAVLPDVAVEPDLLYFPDAVSDDYDPVKMWGLEKIQAEAAWGISTGSKGAVVGIIDSGADLRHPDLVANIWINPGEIANNEVDDDGNGLVDDVNGWDFASNDQWPFDEGRHGTHVSGTVGAVGDNGRGLVGVNWTTRLIIVRAGDDTFPNTALTNAIDYVTDLKKAGVNVVATNNSYGGAGRSTQLESAILRSRNEGILYVTAAGNEESNNDIFPSYPANYDLDNIISVASSNLADRLSIFSNYGTRTVDLAAPGSAIRSTIPGASYGYLSGTSMASPHVAGAVALVHASEPDLDWRELRDRILSTVDPIPALNGRVVTGGRLNLRRALGVTGDLSRAIVQSPGAVVVVLDPPVRDLELIGATGVAPNLARSTWSTVSGPGAVIFSSADELTTRASFPGEGLYRIRFEVESAHRVTEDEITVVVASSPPSVDGLKGFWRFGETGGGTAIDSSGSGRNGSLSGVVRTSGLVGTAAEFDGVSSVMAFNSAPADKISISAWVRSDSLGEFVFPRILETARPSADPTRPGVVPNPDYIFYFGRRTGDVDADINSIKFYASKTVQDGIWHTANDTIRDNKWLHVGVSYDGSDADNFPLIFLDGEVLPVGVDARSGDQARGVVGQQQETVGIGHVGENVDGDRAWDGLIDEVRLYTRAIDRAEMAWIAAENDADIVLDHPIEIGGPPRIGQPFQIETEGENAMSATKFEWWVPEGSGAILRGPVNGSSVTVIMPGGGTCQVRLKATKGLASVIREVEFDLPFGQLPTAGRFKGEVVGDAGNGEVRVTVDAEGRATFLGFDSVRGRLVQGVGVVIDSKGQFEFSSPDDVTWRGQFDQDGFSGVSIDGLSLF